MARTPSVRSESRWSQADFLLGLGCSGILTGGIATFSEDRFRALAPASISVDYAVRVLSVLLLVTVAALVFRWIFAVTGELRLLREHFADFIQPVNGQVYLFTVLFSILLGTLAKLSDNIAMFSLVFAVYSAGDIWGQSLRDRQLKRGFDAARSLEANSDMLAARTAIENYYFERPHLHRSATVMFFSFIALSLSLAGRGSDSGAAAAGLEVAAYAAMIANIIITEIVIWRWRRHRDVLLGDHYSW